MMERGRHFEWDPAKAKRNAIQHGIGFKLATEVFFDPQATYFEDPGHTTHWEERFLVIGRYGKVILIVVFTERVLATRIISARRPNHEEKKWYEEQKD